MSRFPMHVRFFLSQRSRGRKLFAIFLLVVAVLAVVFLLIPADIRSRALGAVSVVSQWLSGVQPEILVGIVAGLLVLLSVILLLVPGYRKHPYLATSPSLIPPVSVYVDAENQLRDPGTIRAFRRFLMEHLDGRRADLLYFLNAASEAGVPYYKALYRSGFRPIDVPHDQTGAGDVKEAVDREISMHAFERALLGPPGQEIIIVSGDGDYIPLVYRLVALGHTVQVWATSVAEPYQRLAGYLNFNVIELKQVLSAIASAPAEDAPDASRVPTHLKPKSRKPRKAPFRGQSAGNAYVDILPPSSLTSVDEERVYWAIAETLRARDMGQTRGRSDQGHADAFVAELSGQLAPRLAGIGYTFGRWDAFWLEHLAALQVLTYLPRNPFPRRGPSSPESAARALVATARATAQAAASVVPKREQRGVTIGEVTRQLLDDTSTNMPQDAAPLRAILIADRGRAHAHVRHFIFMAHALGMLAFEEDPDSAHLIRNPRLVQAEVSADQPEPEERASEAGDASEQGAAFVVPHAVDISDQPDSGLGTPME